MSGANVSMSGGLADDADPPLRAAWATVGVLFLFYLFSMIDRQLLIMMVEPMRRALRIDDFQVSLLLGFSFALFYATGGLVMGWLVDHRSRRAILAIAVALWGLASAACGLAASFEQMFVARLLVGVGEAALGPAAYSMLADAFPARRLAFAISTFATGALIGGAIATLSGGAVIQFARADGGEIEMPLIGALPAWRLAFLVTGLPGPLLALLILLVPEPARRNRTPVHPGEDAPRLDSHLRHNWRLLLPMALGFSAMYVVLSGVFSWTPTYMARSLGLPPLAVGWSVAGLLMLGALPGELFSGWAVDRMSIRHRDAIFRYYLIAIPVAAPFGVAGLLSMRAPLFFLGMLPVFFTFMTFLSTAASAIQIVTPNELRGRVSAVFLVMTTLVGLGGGPTLVVLTASLVGSPAGQLGPAMAIVMVGAALVAMLCLAAARSAYARAPPRRSG